MLATVLDQTTGIAVFEPGGKLSESDFKVAAETIKGYIEQHGKLTGIVIHVKEFPGWESFAALMKHLEFVKKHHKKVVRIAIATDSPVGALAEHVADHFVSARIRKFDFHELEEAQKWIFEQEGDRRDAAAP